MLLIFKEPDQPRCKTHGQGKSRRREWNEYLLNFEYIRNDIGKIV